MRARLLPLVPLALGALGLSFAGARAEPAAGVLGPLIAGVQPDGFLVNVGDLAGPPRPAQLLVFDGSEGGRPVLRVDDRGRSWHLLRAGGLAAGRRYRYQVLLGTEAAGAGEISTAPPPGSTRSLHLAVFGDERGYAAGFSAVTPKIVQAVLGEAPDLVLGTGDLVPEGGDPEAWRRLLECHGPMLRQVPYYPALGNHELIGDPGARNFATVFPQAQRPFYALRYAQVLIVVLDGNRPESTEQLRFLEEELAAAARDRGVRRRFVLLHHAPFSVGAHCGLAQTMVPWVERFERYRVDAVFAGHDHAYERLERNGVAYFVTGGGGAPLYPEAACAAADNAGRQRFEAVYHYLSVRIDPHRDDAVTVTAKTPEGAVFDQVTLPLQLAAAPALLPAEPAGSGPLAATVLPLTPVPLLVGGLYYLRRSRRRSA